MRPLVDLTMIGGRIQRERLRLCLTQTEFGACGGVALRAQQHYEKGRRAPDAAYLVGISGAGADVLYVLTGVRLPEMWRDQLIRVLRTTAAVEPEGGRLTELALQGIAGMVAEESADYGELSTDERQMIALFRRADLTHKMRAVAELQQTEGGDFTEPFGGIFRHRNEQSTG